MMAAKRTKPRDAEKDPTAAPGWALTFGDLMTQLLTFFILLFSVSEVKTTKLFEVFKSFRTAFRKDVPRMGYTILSFRESMRALHTMARNVPSELGRSGSSRMVTDHPFGEFARVVLEEDRLRLVVAAELLFSPGEAELHEGATRKLATVAENLEGSSSVVQIWGHCSPLPLPPGASHTDHMDLGLARARKVYDVLAASWRGRGKDTEIRRLRVGAAGTHDPPLEVLKKEQYDRVEIIITAETADPPADE